MTKLAYCLSGESRRLDGWSNHKNIIDAFQADIYMHSWIKTESGPSDDPFQIRNNWMPYVYSNEESLKIIKPNLYIFEKRQEIEIDKCISLDKRPEMRQYVPRDRVFAMYRGIYLSYILSKLSVIDYDISIRSRSDIKWNCDIVNIIKNSDIKPKRIFIPDGNNGGQVKEGEGVCDWFAFGDYITMEIYHSLYINICKYINDSIPIHPEILLCHHLKVNNIEIIRFPADYELLR